MRVDERERRVARECDALSRRPNGGRRLYGRREVEFARQFENAVAIDMRLDEIGDRLEARLERVRLARLHEAQMAFGQGNLVIARQGAEDGHAHRLDRLDDEPPMPLAADAIDDHARNFEPRVVRDATLDDRRGGLRLTADVDHQQDRYAKRRRHVSRGAGAPACRRNAVEKTHRGFAQSERARSCRLHGERRQKAGRHGPGIEIDAFPSRGCGMEGRVDVIGTGFEADHVQAAPLERAQEPERRRRLAAARARRGDHQAAGHAPAPRQGR